MGPKALGWMWKNGKKRAAFCVNLQDCGNKEQPQRAARPAGHHWPDRVRAGSTWLARNAGNREPSQQKMTATLTAAMSIQG